MSSVATENEGSKLLQVQVHPKHYIYFYLQTKIKGTKLVNIILLAMH